MLTMIEALGSTSVHDKAITVDVAAINTLHNSNVARNTELLPPPLPLPGPVPLTTAGELTLRVSEQVPAGSLIGDRGPPLDKLAPPTDDAEL